jgi:hypothetical protein
VYGLPCQESGGTVTVKRMTDRVRSIGGAPDTARDAEANVREVARLFMTLNHLDTEGLATVIGISRASAYERLNGRRAFTLGELAVMAEHFDVPPSVFLMGPRALISRAAAPVPPSSTGHQGSRIPGVSQPVATPFPRLRAVA